MLSTSDIKPLTGQTRANHKAVTDSFRSIYSINSGIPQGTGVAVGRYSEDSYYNGNPWYLCTLAAAELLYDALLGWESEGAITVTSINLAFFQDLDSSITTGTYASGSSTYTSLYNAVYAYADSYVNVVDTYTPSNGSMSEQFERSSGTPTSAYDLTWSYAAFLSAANRRAGLTPPSWVGSDGNSVPGQCSATSVYGTYSTATATSFPAGETPTTGAGTTSTRTRTSTTTTTSSTRTSTSTACATAQTIQVTFNELVTTTYGQSIKLTGNIAALGNWNTGSAVALSASQYTSSNPLWSVTLSLAAGQVIEYKYINVASNGDLTWEKDPNHTITIAASCATATTISNSWQ